MSNSVSIVTPKNNTPGVRAFVAAAQNLSVPVEVLIVDDQTTVRTLDMGSAAIYRFGPRSYHAFEALSEALSNPTQKTLLINNLRAFDKCLSYKILDDSEVAQPKSEVRTQAGAMPELPVVIKPPIGNQGNGVELVRSGDQFRALEEKYLDEYGRLLVQSYIPESKGSDKRLIIVEGVCVAAMTRKAAAGDFRANLHQGGSATGYAPTQQEVALAVKACQVLGLQFAGVDIIDSQQGPLILEVNPSPGLGISEFVGFDVAEAVLQKIYNV